MNRQRIIGILILIFSIIAAYFIYSNEYAYTGNFSVLAQGITDFEFSKFEDEVAVEVIEFAPADEKMIALYGVEGYPHFMGFAEFKKGWNGKYRVLKTVYGGSPSIERYEFFTKKGSYLAVGGMGSNKEIDSYAEINNERTGESTEEKAVKSKIKEPLFLDIFPIPKNHKVNLELFDAKGEPLLAKYRADEEYYIQIKTTPYGDRTKEKLYMIHVYCWVTISIGIFVCALAYIIKPKEKKKKKKRRKRKIKRIRV